MKEQAYLFGPFLGELSWEFYRFAPYAIHLKKKKPDRKIIVYTRSSRFDLYGNHANILIPLKIEHDQKFRHEAFRLVGFDEIFYKQYVDIFRINYKKKYEIIDHFYPNVSSLLYKVKWQFPRSKMDYDFQPRDKNVKVVDFYMEKLNKKRKNIFVEDFQYENKNYNVIKSQDFTKHIMEEVDNKSVTYIGCLIELIKRCDVVISNLNNVFGHLSILLKTPLIYPNREMSIDKIFLMNPFNTPIFDCNEIKEGVEFYENHI